jgi:hypothetical protein
MTRPMTPRTTNKKGIEGVLPLLLGGGPGLGVPSSGASKEIPVFALLTSWLREVAVSMLLVSADVPVAKGGRFVRTRPIRLL